MTDRDHELLLAHKAGATLPLDVAARLMEEGYILGDGSTAENTMRDVALTTTEINSL